MSFRLCRFKFDKSVGRAGAMILDPAYRRIADEQFRDGEIYLMSVAGDERHDKFRGFFFASVREAFNNLQGTAAEVLTSPTLLRGWALVQTGWADQHVMEAPGDNERQQKAAAERMAVFARSIVTKESYSEIWIRKIDGKWMVAIVTPKSQSRASMTDDDFKKSSKDVLDVLAGQIEVKRRDLESAGRRSAD